MSSFFKVYANAPNLQGGTPIGNGDCVPLVQHFTKVGHTSTWRPGIRVVDSVHIPVGTVIATFENGIYPNRRKGNHACFFLGYGPVSMTTGKPTSIRVMDQWKNRDPFKIAARTINARGKSHAEGSPYHDSDNADTFYVVW